jgi:hypothetical protein
MLQADGTLILVDTGILIDLLIDVKYFVII